MFTAPVVSTGVPINSEGLDAYFLSNYSYNQPDL